MDNSGGSDPMDHPPGLKSGGLYPPGFTPVHSASLDDLGALHASRVFVLFVHKCIET